MNLTSQNLRIPNYSNCQHFLYETITDLRNKGMNFKEIADWLNENGHLTPRGNKFRNNHVHPIAKKRKRRLGIIDKKPTVSTSNVRFNYLK